MEIYMKDILKDLVAHTNALGFIDLVKIVGEDDKTSIEALAADKTVIIQAKTKDPVSEFKGTFGLPDLNKLDLHLKNPEYKDNADIQVVWEKRNGEDRPVMIHFENAARDFKNDYKLMGTELINEKLKTVRFKGATWQVDFEPTVTSIQRLKLQAAANSEETVFMVKTENDQLKIFFGDANTHEGNFVFQTGITGKLRQNWSYPVSQFLSILNLDGDKNIKFSDDGVAQITVDSGLIAYEYLLPAQTK
jgi:hypothetical protein